MLREKKRPTMIRIGRVGRIRLTSVMRWIAASMKTAEPDPNRGHNQCTYGRSDGCYEAEGQSYRHPPHERQHQVAAPVIGAGQAVDLAIDDQPGVNIGLILEHEPGGNELVRAFQRPGIVFARGRVSEEANLRPYAVETPFQHFFLRKADGNGPFDGDIGDADFATVGRQPGERYEGAFLFML